MAEDVASSASARSPAPPPDEGGGRAAAAALSLAALAVASVLTFQAWRGARRAEDAEVRARFAVQVADAEALVRQRMLGHEHVLRGAAGLFAASQSVERGEFAAYVAALRLQERYPGIQGVGFARLVPARARAAHEAAVRREGFPGYAIRPDGDRDPYTSIVYLEPFEGRNLRAFGYDMWSEPVRQAAMARARDTGQAALSGRVTLVQETASDVQAGALLYLPVYRHAAPQATPEERRAALVGWVYSPYRMGDLMRGILGAQADGLDVELFDGEVASPAALLFDADPAHASTGHAAAALHEVRAIEIAGRRWTMVLDARMDHDATPETPRSALVALAGGGGGAVLAMLLWALAASRARAAEAAARAGREAAERRRAAEAVEASHRFARATLDAMPEQICVLDEAGVILSVNLAWRAFGAANGAPPDGAGAGASYLAVCDRAAAAGDPGAARIAGELRALLEGRRGTLVHEYECHSPSARRWFVIHATRFADAARVRVVVVHQDVTERLEAVAALRESEARLREATAAAGQAPWLLDLSTGRGDFEEAWGRLLGRAPPAPATLEALLEAAHPDDRPRALGAVRACAEGQAEGVDVEHRVQAAGGWRWVRMAGRIIARDGDGRPLRMAGTLTDVDRVHALQERLLAATRLASVGTLAAGVAHEINNPLAWMHANLSLALEHLDRLDGPEAGAARAELGELVGEALEGTDRIASIVRAMRSLGRPERPEEAQRVDVGGELRGAVQLVRNQLQQRAALSVDLPPDLPPVRARTSELGRVFLNLLLNAAHAVGDAPGGAHRIEVAARAEGGEVVVEVRDTGPGIPAGVRERIFDPFFTTKPVGQGTGLGLSIARSIVDAAGGRIEVESEPGRGATFRVRLPVAPAPAAAATGPAPTPPPAPVRRRVLLVDDEPLVARSLERLLSRTHDVTVLGSAEAALGRLDAGERWDALLFDLMMPGVDGAAVHAAVAERHPALLGRLAFLTGGAFGGRATGFLATHPVPVLPKPVELPALLSLVERLAAA